MEPIDLENMMADVAPLVEAAEVRQYESNRWVFAFDEDFFVEIEHDVDLAKLVFTTEVGQPLPGAEAESYKLMLYLAFMWRETGGLRMSLNPKDDMVFQVYDCPVADLKVEVLEINLKNFVNAARHAKTVLASNVGEISENIDDAHLHFMRV